MERRQFLSNASAAMVLAAAAAGPFALADDAAPDASKKAAPHAGKHRFTSPGLELAMSASHCVGHGEACLQHCIDMLSTGNKDMADCAKSVREMLTACRAVGDAAARGSKNLVAYAKIALQACQDCEKECRKHPQMGVCLDCADACAECATHCQGVIGSA